MPKLLPEIFSTEDFDSKHPEFTIPFEEKDCGSYRYNPEKEFIENEAFHNLSIEAKGLLYIIFNTPIETLEAMLGGEPSMRKLRTMLRNLQWPWHKIISTINEIKEFIREIYP